MNSQNYTDCPAIKFMSICKGVNVMMYRRYTIFKATVKCTSAALWGCETETKKSPTTLQGQGLSNIIIILQIIRPTGNCSGSVCEIGVIAP